MKNYIIFLTLLISGCGLSMVEDDNKTTNNQSSENNPFLNKQIFIYNNQNISKYKTKYRNIDENAHMNLDKNSKYSGKGIKIAIIDDGLDISHEDLKGAVKSTFNLVDKSLNVSHDQLSDRHGTAVTGIIAARNNNIGIKGIASNSEIAFLKYSKKMSDTQIVEILRRAENFNPDIINCSWGTGNIGEAVKETIKDIANNGRDGKGIIIVFAAGNSNEEIGNDESSLEEVIGVGSSDEYNERASYSNYGKALDLLAFGGKNYGVTTLDPMGSYGVSNDHENYLFFDDARYFNGTSASAPIVSATVALMLEANPNLTRKQVQDILKQTSDKIGNVTYDKNGHNTKYGYGKLNINKAIKKAEELK